MLVYIPKNHSAILFYHSIRKNDIAHSSRGKKIENNFKIGDLIRCQEFDVSSVGLFMREKENR